MKFFRCPPTEMFLTMTIICFGQKSTGTPKKTVFEEAADPMNQNAAAPMMDQCNLTPPKIIF